MKAQQGPQKEGLGGPSSGRTEIRNSAQPRLCPHGSDSLFLPSSENTFQSLPMGEWAPDNGVIWHMTSPHLDMKLH